MKKFILSAIAATLAAGPVLATAAEAAPIQRERTVIRERANGRTVITQRSVVRQPQYRQQRNQYRNWRKGERFDRRYAQNYRQIDYRQYRGLRAPPRGYQYYQSGNDAVLVAVASGLIGAVIGGALR
jgi:Ni/Co efflux regulator RcnB